MNIKGIEDGILKVCPDLVTCRNLWASDAIRNKSCCFFNCQDCVSYQCYILGYKEAENGKDSEV